MQIQKLGKEQLEQGIVILDSNIVNPFVVGFSGDKKINNLFPHVLIEALSSTTKFTTVWQIGACESYMQRGMEQKSDLLVYCDSLFMQLSNMTATKIEQLLECPRERKVYIAHNRPASIYVEIYQKHLSIYSVMLKLLATRQDDNQGWQRFTQWITINQLDIDPECFVFAKLFLQDTRGFAFEKLTHSNGEKTGDQVAKCAWNVAWDILLLSSLTQTKRNGILYTQDIGFREYYKYRFNNQRTSVIQKKHSSKKELSNLQHLGMKVRNQESELGISTHYDAKQSFKGGVKRPIIVSQAQ